MNSLKLFATGVLRQVLWTQSRSGERGLIEDEDEKEDDELDIWDNAFAGGRETYTYV